MFELEKMSVSFLGEKVEWEGKNKDGLVAGVTVVVAVRDVMEHLDDDWVGVHGNERKKIDLRRDNNNQTWAVTKKGPLLRMSRLTKKRTTT